MAGTYKVLVSLALYRNKLEGRIFFCFVSSFQRRSFSSFEGGGGIEIQGDKIFPTNIMFLRLMLLYRVDRVVSFFFSHRNWDSPIPSHAGECVPSPLWFRGGTLTVQYSTYCTCGWVRGGEGSQFPRWDRHCVTLGICVLFGYYFHCCYLL